MFPAAAAAPSPDKLLPMFMLGITVLAAMLLVIGLGLGNPRPWVVNGFSDVFNPHGNAFPPRAPPADIFAQLLYE